MVITPAFAELTQHEPHTMFMVKTIKAFFIRFIASPKLRFRDCGMMHGRAANRSPCFRRIWLLPDL